MLIFADFADSLQQAIFDAAEMLFYPVLIAAVVCLIWVLIELGWLAYELYLRFRYRDLDTRTGQEILELFQNLSDKGNTLIVVTHEEHVARHARRIIRIRDGLIASDERRPGL